MDIDHLHLYVEDSRRWHDWFIHTLGLTPKPLDGAMGLWGVEGANIRLRFSDPTAPGAEVKTFLQRYSPGVGDVAFRVKDLVTTLNRAIRAGAQVTQPRQQWAWGWGCQIQGWGGLRHTLMEWAPSVETSPPDLSERSGTIAPTPMDKAVRSIGVTAPKGLDHPLGISAPEPDLPWQAIDHVVLNVPLGDLDAAVAWYCQVLGFERQQSFEIETAQSGLRSQVLQHPEGSATLPINEPTSPNSQVQEFLNCHGGAGIQHVALRTGNLVQTLMALRQRGLSLLPVPRTYYDALGDRPGFWAAAEDWTAIAQQQILVDWDPATPQARLLQTFTHPLFERPTFFLELIERQRVMRGLAVAQAQGFGEGNFRALFEAIERQQQQRGSL
jgi:4-hydroxyphenylpyruvate dioxygenase